MKYTYTVVGLPFMPKGRVLDESKNTVAEVDYTGQSERRLTLRLSRMCKLFEKIERELAATQEQT